MNLNFEVSNASLSHFIVTALEIHVAKKKKEIHVAYLPGYINFQ